MAARRRPARDEPARPRPLEVEAADAAVDIEAWIAAEVDIAFAEQEGEAFVSGDGVLKPKGFLSYDQVDDGAWEWGKIGTVATGAAGAFAASGASDVLINVVYALKAGYRQNAHFVMNRKTQSAIRKLKETMIIHTQMLARMRPAITACTMMSA